MSLYHLPYYYLDDIHSRQDKQNDTRSAKVDIGDLQGASAIYQVTVDWLIWQDIAPGSHMQDVISRTHRPWDGITRSLFNS